MTTDSSVAASDLMVLGDDPFVSGTNAPAIGDELPGLSDRSEVMGTD